MCVDTGHLGAFKVAFKQNRNKGINLLLLLLLSSLLMFCFINNKQTQIFSLCGIKISNYFLSFGKSLKDFKSKYLAMMLCIKILRKTRILTNYINYYFNNCLLSKVIKKSRKAVKCHVSSKNLRETIIVWQKKTFISAFSFVLFVLINVI